MMKLSKKEIYEIAKSVGLNLDDGRATTIASRLSYVLGGLNEIPKRELIRIEPSQTFVVARRVRDD